MDGRNIFVKRTAYFVAGNSIFFNQKGQKIHLSCTKVARNYISLHKLIQTVLSLNECDIVDLRIASQHTCGSEKELCNAQTKKCTICFNASFSLSFSYGSAATDFGVCNL